MLFGSFGDIPINRATIVQTSQAYPVAESEVALGTPSTQPLSRRLEDRIMQLTFYGPSASDNAALWKAAGKSREPKQLVIAGRPEGLYWITLVDEDVKHSVGTKIDWITLRITFKEVGAFAWTGNYSLYEPPENVRKSAEAGVSGLSRGVLNWLNIK